MRISTVAINDALLSIRWFSQLHYAYDGTRSIATVHGLVSNTVCSLATGPVSSPLFFPFLVLMIAVAL